MCRGFLRESADDRVAARPVRRFGGGKRAVSASASGLCLVVVQARGTRDQLREDFRL